MEALEVDVVGGALRDAFGVSRGARSRGDQARSAGFQLCGVGDAGADAGQMLCSNPAKTAGGLDSRRGTAAGCDTGTLRISGWEGADAIPALFTALPTVDAWFRTTAQLLQNCTLQFVRTHSVVLWAPWHCIPLCSTGTFSALLR